MTAPSVRPARRRAHMAAAFALIVAITSYVVDGRVAQEASAASGSQTFTSNGSFVVPAAVTELQVVVSGAAGGDGGGDSAYGNAPGGLGGRVTGTISVTPGETLDIRLGSPGSDGGSRHNPGPGGGAWRGAGGAGGQGSLSGGAGGGGGGATNLMSGSTTLITAGGGGGGGGAPSLATGGAGGSNGGNGQQGGAGGGSGGIGHDTSTYGGNSGTDAGSSSSSGGGGGGGGGWDGGRGGQGGGGVGRGGGGGAGGSNRINTSRVSSPSTGSASSYGGRVEISWVQTFPTTTTITSVTDEITYGDDAVIEASVSATGSQGVPTGAVQLVLDGTDLGAPVPVGSTGNVRFEIADLDVGNHAVDLLFVPTNDDFGPSSTSTSIAVEPDVTTTLIASTAPASVVGQAVTFTASVTAASPTSGAPTGSVAFTIDGDPIAAPVALAPDGTASVTVDDLDIGNREVRAVYSGSTHHIASDASMDQVVNPGDVAIVVDSDRNPAVIGEIIELEARVAIVAPAVGDPTGTVTFSTPDGVIGDPIPVDATGTALMQTSTLPLGTSPVTASYRDDPIFEPADSAAYDQIVNPGEVDVTLTPDTRDAIVGVPVTFDVSVTGLAPAVAELTGTVQLVVGGTPLGDPVAVDASGAGRITTDALPLGINEVTARYQDDVSFQESSSRPERIAVNQGDTIVDLRVDPIRMASGEQVTFTATVTATDPAAGQPTGTVTFQVDGLPVAGPQMLDASGRADLQTNGLAVGRHSVTATYGGDERFTAAVSPVMSVEVDEVDSDTDARDSGTGTGRLSASGRGSDGTGGRSGGDSLARTGAPIFQMGAVALLALALGAAAVGASRRRPTDSPL